MVYFLKGPREALNAMLREEGSKRKVHGKQLREKAGVPHIWLCLEELVEEVVGV